MKVCVCLDAMTPSLPLDAALRVAAAAGAVEFWDWRTRDIDALERLARGLGLGVVAFSGNTFAEPLVDARSHLPTLRHLARSVRVAQRLGVRLLVTHVGYKVGRSHRAQWEAAVRGLRQAGDLAAGAGITLAVEPLNSLLDHPGYFLDTLDAALILLGEVNHPAVRLLLDVYHMRMMHDDLLDRLPEALPLTVHVHVADVPGRGEPGTGAIHWPAVMDALREHGYQGAIGLECRPSVDAERAVRSALELLA